MTSPAMTAGGSPTSDAVLAGVRASCYKARDSFYACFEKESAKKPTEVASVGLRYAADSVRLCRSTWVKNFDCQYCAKKRVQRLLDSEDTRKGPQHTALK